MLMCFALQGCVMYSHRESWRGKEEASQSRLRLYCLYLPSFSTENVFKDCP
jgi:hypothetical protein